MIAEKLETKTVEQTGGGSIDLINVKSENLSDIICHGRRMRELSKEKYDHEVIQRNYIDNKGPAPSGTDLMNKLNIK